jgi:hypothetical protein
MIPPKQATKATFDADSATRQDHSSLRLSGQVINIILVAFSIAAAYFMTIQSLKLELSAKAESAVVNALDKKLGEFEILLREGVVSKEEFYRISAEADKRLARIEYHLTNQSGDARGNR